MGNWSKEDAARYAIRRASRARNRACPELQEQQASHPREADHKPQTPKVDGAVRGQFHAAITLLVSDERERDGDGAESTLLDCLIDARERLLQMSDPMLLALLQISKRTGGR